MVFSLLPEKQLVISPALATTIGLEEAVLLAVLHELFMHRAQNGWLKLEQSTLQAFLPFWQPQDVQRISGSLCDKGILQLRSAPYLSSHVLDFSLADGSVSPAPPVAAATTQPPPSITGRATLLSPNWQPDAELLRQLAQLGVAQEFVMQQVPEFVRYWRERGEAHHAWGNRFLKQVLRNWREQEQHGARLRMNTPMVDGWLPGIDAIEILERAGVSRAFIDDSVPEFVLYWRERGDQSSTWDSKFLQHVRRQWAIFTAKLANDPTPRPITPDWQPSGDVYDILQLASIDEAFARAQLSEFVLYWLDSKQVHASWNSKFLHHVKYRWARRHQQPWQGETDGFIATHTDRSWADGL
ncbi:MAG TPA: DnaT-like ssDNA-binding domain-containing protein [Pseudomonadales bacterium]|nr:DnaT-like ssDNA-binding domain-containing protein [Pseudomonadales bacterium]